MATEGERIARQMQQAFEGQAWFGPCVQDVLADVDAKTAAAHPIEGTHSIWEIVHHLLGAQRVVLARVAGQPLELTEEEEWPEVDKISDAAWQATVNELIKGNDRMRAAVSGYPVEKLDEPFFRATRLRTTIFTDTFSIRRIIWRRSGYLRGRVEDGPGSLTKCNFVAR